MLSSTKHACIHQACRHPPASDKNSFLGPKRKPLYRCNWDYSGGSTRSPADLLGLARWRQRHLNEQGATREQTHLKEKRRNDTMPGSRGSRKHRRKSPGAWRRRGKDKTGRTRCETKNAWHDRRRQKQKCPTTDVKQQTPKQPP